LSLQTDQAATAWWAEDSGDVAARLSTDLSDGLESDAAAGRLAEVGANELEEEPATPLWLVFLGQFANTMIIVLLIAARSRHHRGDRRGSGRHRDCCHRHPQRRDRLRAGVPGGAGNDRSPFARGTIGADHS
jgi:hypothetical protein